MTGVAERSSQVRVSQAEMRRWLEDQPFGFRVQLEVELEAVRRARADHGWHRGEYQASRRVVKAMLRGGLLAQCKRPDPDCLDELAYALEYGV